MNLEDKKENLIKDFQKGLLLKEFEEKYGINSKLVSKYLSSLGYNFRKRRQKVFWNPFEDINNSEVQYWLGWLASDGSIHKDRISLQLSRKDIDVLYNFKTFLKEAVSIRTFTWSISNKEFPACSISFRNKEIVSFLETLGLTSNKTFNLNPKFEITPSFLRGFIEGDGTLELKKIEDRNIGRVRISTASKYMASKIINFYLLNNLYFRYYSNKSRIKFHEIVVSKREDVLKLLDMLYNNANTFMERKYCNAVQIRDSLNNYTLNSGNQH